MAEFTLLKLELDGDSFTAAPFGGDTDETTEAGETDEGSGSIPLGALAVGLLFLVALAVVAKKLAGEDEGPVEAGDLT